MNKKFCFSLAVGALLGVSSICSAGSLMAGKNSAKACEPTKIAVISLNKIYQEAPQMKDGREEAKKKFKDRVDKLNERSTQLQKEFDDFNKNASTMKDAEKEKKAKDLFKKRDELGKDQDALQRENAEYFEQLEKSFSNDLNRAVSSVAEEKKIDLIINQNQIVAIYNNSDKVADVTQDVLSKLK